MFPEKDIVLSHNLDIIPMKPIKNVALTKIFIKLDQNDKGQKTYI